MTYKQNDDKTYFGCFCCPFVITLFVLLLVLAPGPQIVVSDDIIAQCAPALEGQPIPNAARYDTSSNEPHPMVIINQNGSRHYLTDDFSSVYSPTNISQLELVIICSENQAEAIEVCYYVNGPPITRYQYYIDVLVIEAKSGETLTAGQVWGTPPRECGSQEDVDTVALYGESVDASNLLEWLVNNNIQNEDTESSETSDIFSLLPPYQWIAIVAAIIIGVISYAVSRHYKVIEEW